MPPRFDRSRFRRVFRKILRSGQIRISPRIRREVEVRGYDTNENPYVGHCAQATNAAWVLGKEIYKENFEYEPYCSPDGWHYWLAKPTDGKVLRKHLLDLTEHETDGKFDYQNRKSAWRVRRRMSQKDLARMTCVIDTLRLYKLAKEELMT